MAKKINPVFKYINISFVSWFLWILKMLFNYLPTYLFSCDACLENHINDYKTLRQDIFGKKIAF